MWQINDRGLRWRSGLLVTAIFLPAAPLIGWLIPGWWWWLGAAVYFIAFAVAMNAMAKRDRRIAGRGSTAS
jgi:hypothetical protein